MAAPWCPVYTSDGEKSQEKKRNWMKLEKSGQEVCETIVVSFCRGMGSSSSKEIAMAQSQVRTITAELQVYSQLKRHSRDTHILN